MNQPPGEQEQGLGKLEEVEDLAPREPGSYVLVLHLEQPARITVGKLGTFDFEAGWYAYAGSALGPGGLAARIAHHRQPEKTFQWHIDYLSAHAQLVEIWYAVDKKRKECVWASALRSIPGAQVPIPNFGATDCRCLAHMVYSGQQPAFTNFARALSDLEF